MLDAGHYGNRANGSPCAIYHDGKKIKLMKASKVEPTENNFNENM